MAQTERHETSTPHNVTLIQDGGRIVQPSPETVNAVGETEAPPDIPLKEEGPKPEAHPIPVHRPSLTRSPSDRPLLCKDVLSKEHVWPSLDGVATDYACASDSEPGFTSDSEIWSEEEEDGSDESVLCLTSNGARPLDTTDSLRPPLPRRLSFKPLEQVSEEAGSSSRHMNPESSTVAARPDPQSLSPIIVAEVSPGEMFRNEYFAVAKSSTAGWGAFATKDLKYGDRILMEKPLFVADSRSLFKEYRNLDLQRQEVAMSLHANELTKPGTLKLQAIWTTNCFAVSASKKGGGKAGLFPIAARFNHACDPNDNIEYIYNKRQGYLEMFVKADEIPAGEELMISYGDRSPADLYVRYGFRCECGACAGLSDREVRKLDFPWY